MATASSGPSWTRTTRISQCSNCVPQASQFPQAAAIIERMHAMIININADDGVDAHFQAVCDSVDDANLLSAAMQAGLMYRRYQEAQTNPALAKTIDQVRVSNT